MAGPGDHFRQSISYALLTGRDVYGKPMMSAIAIAPARVQPSRKTVRNANGDEQQASYVVYTSAAITLQHRVWFPGEDTSDFGAARRVIAVDSYVDGAGVERFRKVWF